MVRYVTNNEQETVNLGAEFANNNLKVGDVVALYGDLGSGKTRFIRGICKGLNVSEHVTSPSFTIINEYFTEKFKIYHFDFYRVSSLDEINEIGFDDYIYNDGICLIEWADRVKDILPLNRYDVFFQLGEKENIREIIFEKITSKNS